MATGQAKKREAKFHDFVLNTRLRDLSKRVDINELASSVGVSVEAVRLWMSGYSRPDMEKVVALAKYLGVTTDYLLGASDRKVVSYTNYADVSRILLEFISSGIAAPTVERWEDGEIRDVAFRFSNYEMQSFFAEFSHMTHLFADKSITKNIFDSWLSSEFNKLLEKPLPQVITLDDLSQMPSIGDAAFVTEAARGEAPADGDGN